MCASITVVKKSPRVFPSDLPFTRMVRGPDTSDGVAALNEHRALADVIASRNVERARAEMLKVLGDFPAEIKRTLESR